MKRRMIEAKGVKSVHDLHVWCVTPTRMYIMSGHVGGRGGGKQGGAHAGFDTYYGRGFRNGPHDHPEGDEGYQKAPSEHI